MIATLLILSLTTGLASPSPLGPLATVSGTTAGPSEVALRIDPSGLLDHESAPVVEHTVFFVREDAVEALGRSPEVELVDDPRAATIVVNLAWVSHESSIYGVSVQTQRPGEAPRLLERFECECINSGLAKAVAERIPAALEQLAPPPVAPPIVGDPTPGPVDTPPEREPLGAKGKVGIGLLAAGGAGVVSGGLVFMQRRRYDAGSSEREERSGRNFEPPGVALMVAGGVVAVTGAVLLIVDRVRTERAKRTGATRSRSARLAPSLGDLALTLRF